MPNNATQTLFFRGIYEYQDPSGSILCARVPFDGLADLYEGTAIFVRPNQCALVVHKGQITDLFSSGTHSLSSENLPVLTKLANIKFGFKSPIRTELYFFSGSQFTARRWGTAQPAFAKLSGKSIPIRAYGQYNIRLSNPQKFFMKLMGTRASFSVSDIEEFVQGQLIQFFPQALAGVKEIGELSSKQPLIASQLSTLVQKALKDYGLIIENLQVLSVLPSKEVLQAMDASAAMEIIGDNREYLLYKAAATLESLQSGGGAGGAKGDPMHMMMGLMLGRNLLGGETRPKIGKDPVVVSSNKVCKSCGQMNALDNKFCPKCGKELL